MFFHNAFKMNPVRKFGQEMVTNDNGSRQWFKTMVQDKRYKEIVYGSRKAKNSTKGDIETARQNKGL